MTQILRCYKCGSPLANGSDGELVCRSRCDSAANLRHVIRATPEIDRALHEALRASSEVVCDGFMASEGWGGV